MLRFQIPRLHTLYASRTSALWTRKPLQSNLQTMSAVLWKRLRAVPLRDGLVCFSPMEMRNLTEQIFRILTRPCWPRCRTECFQSKWIGCTGGCNRKDRSSSRYNLHVDYQDGRSWIYFVVTPSFLYLLFIGARSWTELDGTLTWIFSIRIDNQEIARLSSSKTCPIWNDSRCPRE